MDISLVPSFYRGYVEKVQHLDLVPSLLNSGDSFISLGRALSEAKAKHRYAEDKWSIKDIILHIIDAERIFAYRALRFARNDGTELSGYDHNAFVQIADADLRPVHSLITEFTNVRAATIDMFSSFDGITRKRNGICNGLEMSVETLGYIIAGHVAHHQEIIETRYL